MGLPLGDLDRGTSMETSFLPHNSVVDEGGTNDSSIEARCFLGGLPMFAALGSFFHLLPVPAILLARTTVSQIL